MERDLSIFYVHQSEPVHKVIRMEIGILVIPACKGERRIDRVFLVDPVLGTNAVIMTAADMGTDPETAPFC